MSKMLVPKLTAKPLPTLSPFPACTSSYLGHLHSFILSVGVLTNIVEVSLAIFKSGLQKTIWLLSGFLQVDVLRPQPSCCENFQETTWRISW